MGIYPCIAFVGDLQVPESLSTYIRQFCRAILYKVLNQ